MLKSHCLNFRIIPVFFGEGFFILFYGTSTLRKKMDFDVKIFDVHIL